jgi:hypothetical protein
MNGPLAELANAQVDLETARCLLRAANAKVAELSAELAASRAAQAACQACTPGAPTDSEEAKTDEEQ